MGKKKKVSGRRLNGEGSIYQRQDGRWCCQLTIEGSPRYFYGKSSEEVQEKRDQARELIRKNALPEPNKVTVTQWMKTWLENYKKDNLKQATYHSYEQTINLHIIPDIGNRKLKDLRPSHIQKLLNDKFRKGRIKEEDKKKAKAKAKNQAPVKVKSAKKKDTKKTANPGLSAKTVKYIHGILLQALDQAIKERLIAYNPANTGSIQLPRREKPDIQPLYTDQARDFLLAIKDDWLYPLFLTDISTGLRRGELLGLKWPDINFKDKTATIKRSLIQVGGKPILQESVKTKGSKRVVSLTDDVVAELKKLQDQQEKDRSALDEGLYQENDFVFCWQDGRALRPDYVYRHFQKLLKKHNFPMARFHDLRHSFATIMLEQGVEMEVVSTMMGHYSISMTADIYSHVRQELQDTAASKMNAALNANVEISTPQGQEAQPPTE